MNRCEAAEAGSGLGTEKRGAGAAEAGLGQLVGHTCQAKVSGIIWLA